jgi:hypothetical protein
VRFLQGGAVAITSHINKELQHYTALWSGTFVTGQWFSRGMYLSRKYKWMCSVQPCIYHLTIVSHFSRIHGQ